MLINSEGERQNTSEKKWSKDNKTKIKAGIEVEYRRWWRSRWMWSTFLFSDPSGIHLQIQKCMQNTSWEPSGVSDQWKKYIEPCKTLQDKGTRGKNRSVRSTGPALSWWGNLNRGPVPTLGQLSDSHFI